MHTMLSCVHGSQILIHVQESDSAQPQFSKYILHKAKVWVIQDALQYDLCCCAYESTWRWLQGSRKLVSYMDSALLSFDLVHLVTAKGERVCLSVQSFMLRPLTA